MIPFFNDPETKYWQERYKKNPNDPIFDDLSGESLALLDGSASKIFWEVLIVVPVVVFLITIAMCAVLKW